MEILPLVVLCITLWARLHVGGSWLTKTPESQRTEIRAYECEEGAVAAPDKSPSLSPCEPETRICSHKRWRDVNALHRLRISELTVAAPGEELRDSEQGSREGMLKLHPAPKLASEDKAAARALLRMGHDEQRSLFFEQRESSIALLSQASSDAMPVVSIKRGRNRVLQGKERSVKPGSELTPSREVSLAASNLLLMASNAPRSLISEKDTAVKIDPAGAANQRPIPLSRSQVLKNSIHQGPVHAGETSRVQQFPETQLAVPRKEGIKCIDHYILSTLPSAIKDHTSQLIHRSNTDQLFGREDFQKKEKLEEQASGDSPHHHFPNTVLAPVKPEIISVAKQHLTQFLFQNSPDLASTRTFVASVVQRWKLAHHRKNYKLKQEERLFNHFKEKGHFGLDLQIITIEPFGTYTTKGFRGTSLPKYGPGGKTEYLKLVHEIDIRSGLKRAILLQLVPQAEQVFRAIARSARERSVSVGNCGGRSPQKWMEFIKRCTYKVMNYIVLLEYVTTPFKVEHLFLVRRALSKFLFQSKCAWVFFFEEWQLGEDSGESANLLLQPHVIHDIVASGKKLGAIGQESKCVIQLVVSWWIKEEAKPLGSLLTSCSNLQAIGLCRFLDDCSIVEWIEASQST